ncbi:MAG: hypothetical protein O7B99_08665 [Planctomycetota bacterium]|nr:hypothetical protein [Planctomycetota bacterium]
MPVPEISALARQIASSDPLNTEEQGLVAKELRKLRELVHRSGTDELGGCVDAAILLTEMLGRGKRIEAPHLHRIVCLLIGTVERNFERPERRPHPTQKPATPAAAQEAAPAPTPAPVPEVRAKDGEDEVQTAKAFELLGDKLVGEILVELGSVTREQIFEGLALARTEQLRIGEALIKLGHAKSEHVESALKIQAKLRKAAGVEAPSKKTVKLPESKNQLRLATERLLGEVLAQLGFATPTQVADGLRIQRAVGQPLGEAMMSLGYCTRPQISKALEMQKQLRHFAGDPSAAE